MEFRLADVQAEEFEMTKKVIKGALSGLKVEKVIDYLNTYLKSSEMHDR